MLPTPKPHNSVTDTPWVCRDLYTLAQATDSSEGHELYRVECQGVRKVGLLHPQGWCHKEESASPKKGDICSVGEGLSTETLAALLSALSPEPQLPVSPHETLVCSIIPLLEPRLSGCQWDFVLWCSKRVPVSRSDSLLPVVDRILLIFTARCVWYLFPLRCSVLESPAWPWDPLLLSCDLCSWDSPTESQPPPWEWGWPFSFSTIPTSLYLLSFVYSLL